MTPEREAGLAALAERLEADRRAAREEAGRRLRLAGLVGLGAAILGLLLAWAAQSALGLLGVPVVVGFLIWSRRPLGAFEARVRADLYPEVVRLVDEGLAYAPEGGVDQDALSRAGLLPSFEDAAYTHRLSGTYRGLPVACCHAHLTRTETTRRTDSQGRTVTETRTVTVFNGHFAILGTPGPLPTRVFLRRDGGWLGKLSERGPDGSRQVHTEDPGFERRFDLYADDQVAARVLFTTTYMARVLAAAEDLDGALAATYEGDTLAVSLAGSRSALDARRVTTREGLKETLTRVARETEALLDGLRRLLPPR